MKKCRDNKWQLDRQDVLGGVGTKPGFLVLVGGKASKEDGIVGIVIVIVTRFVNGGR